MKKIIFLPCMLGVTLLFLGSTFTYGKPPCSGQPQANTSNQIVLDWNLIALQAMSSPWYEWSCVRPRIMAMTHLAMHDALNAITPTYATYALQKKDTQADPQAAAATAAYTVLIASVPEQKPLLDSAFQAALATLPTGDKLNRGVTLGGVTLGKQAAEKILSLRKEDGAFQDYKGSIQASTHPGAYQAVPHYDFVLSPFWKTMLPFSLQKPDQFRCPPPPALVSKVYSDDFQEVKQIGSKNSQTSTADQRFYAQFWYEASEIGWNRVARLVVEDKKTDLLATARLFALLNMALVDALTAGWDAKYHYNFWRPCTAILTAAKDGNPATTADTSWQSLMETPPVADYPSTHSALGNAAATILSSLLGDKTRFTMTSSTAQPTGTTRSFTSFSQAAKENADSRVMAGIHFRFSCQAGLELGQKVGKWTVAQYLRPLSVNSR